MGSTMPDMVTFRATGHHYPLNSVKLCCLIHRHVCVWTTCPEWLHKVEQPESTPLSLSDSGFQCTRELCSRLWCWCGSVLTALLPASSPNSATLFPLLQVVSISGQPRCTYYKFPEPEPRSAGGASLSRDHLHGTVFLLLYGDQRWLCTLSRGN